MYKKSMSLKVVVAWKRRERLLIKCLNLSLCCDKKKDLVHVDDVISEQILSICSEFLLKDTGLKIVSK